MTEQKRTADDRISQLEKEVESLKTQVAELLQRTIGLFPVGTGFDRSTGMGAPEPDITPSEAVEIVHRA